MYVYQFKAFIHEMLQYCMHSRTHPIACAHTQTLTSYIKLVLRNLAHAWFNSFHVILSTHSILVCTKYLKLLNIPAYCRAPMYVYDICMPCYHLTTLTIIRLIHHPKGWAECCTYVHMFVIYHVQSTVYCPFKYLGYTVFSNPYLSVYL